MTQDAADLRFDSPEQEVRHWKSKVADMQDALRETESSLQDFMESSKELEAEMEKELTFSNKTISDLKRRNEQMQGDLDDWKSKYSKALSEHNSTLTQLQKELALLKEAVDLYKTKLRDTEMTNDELENAERMVASSLADMEGRYHRTIEKTALLEEELIEKARLEEENQRLKDELREMTEEMAVLRDVVGRSRAVSRADTFASSTTHDESVAYADTSFSPKKSNLAGLDRPSSRQTAPSPSLNRVPVSRRLGALNHSRRTSRGGPDVSHLTAVQDDSPDPASASLRTPGSVNMLRRDTLVGTPSGRTGLTSSPSARAQLRASVRAATRNGIPPRTPAAAPLGTKRMMADMISKMKALETRINSAKDLSRVVAPGDESAIPRPSSRMGTSILGSHPFNSPGHTSVMLTSTPRAGRASMDGNRTIGSSIPVPSRVRRPSSRMSESVTPPMPSLGLPRSAAPSSSTQRGASPLDFMKHDPANTLPYASQYAAAQASASRRRSSISASTTTTGMSHSTSIGTLAKVRTASSVSRPMTPGSASSRASSSLRIHGHADEVGTSRMPLSTRLAAGHRPPSSARGSTTVTAAPTSWKPSLTHSRTTSAASNESH